MKKILLIDIRYLEKPNTGIAVGLKAFLVELEKIINLNDYKVYLLYHKKLKFESKVFKSIQINSHLFSIKEHFELYKIFKEYKIDVFYSHHFLSPILKTKKLKTINIIHDLIPLHAEVLSVIGKKYYYFMNKWSIKKSNVVVANSLATKMDIQNIFKRKDIKVIYHSYNKEKLQYLDNSIIKKLNLEDTNYFLFVSSLKKHKNYELIIEIFKQNKFKDFKLVLVGREDTHIKNNNENIVFTGYISDAELNSLYKSAIALLFPSLIEGFGVPILEAQYHKLPIITSNISSMPEVAGKGAILVNPHRKEEIEKAMEYILIKKNRKNLIEEGTKNLQRFSWKEYTKQIIKIMENLK
jgi:glycosyltransferase involved in cell wall biosynthesis